MRDFTIETFLIIGAMLALGFIGALVFGAGIPALAAALLGFCLGVYAFTRRLP